MSIVVCNNNSLSAITSIPASITGSALNLISTQTASSSATISFTSGIDSTYKEYIFKFINIHTATDNTQITFQGNASGGSGFNETITSTYFQAYHNEGGSDTALSYVTSRDQAQGTSFQKIADGLGTDNDQSASGFLHLFNPSSTTFVKHFMSRLQIAHYGEYSQDEFIAGYFNTTSAIDEIQFKMSSGNIDSGTIKLYGVV